MSYRDDRDAWRQKAEQLEQELQETKRRLEQRPPGGSRAIEPAAPQVQHSGLVRAGGWPVAAALAVVVVMGVGMAAAAGASIAALAPAAIALIVLAAMILTVSSAVHVVPPNRALVLSGRRVQRPDGSVAGFRVLRGGRAVRVPLVESAATLDLELKRIEVAIDGALARAGRKVDIVLSAWVGIATAPPGLDAAAERFLGMQPEALTAVARDTLEGALRQAVSEVTIEQIVTDRLAFRDYVVDAAEEDLRKLGLVLESICVLSVGDREGYLDGLGRERIARALRDAAIRQAEGR